MTDTFLQVDFQAMETLIDQLGKLEQQAQNTMQDLTKQLDGHLASWNGAAREAYVHHKAEWDRTFASLTQALAAARQHVGDSNSIYQDTETSVTKMMAG